MAFNKDNNQETKGLIRDCNICELKGKKVRATYDAKTKRGPWAYLCDEHMESDAHPGYRAAATKLSEVRG